MVRYAAGETVTALATKEQAFVQAYEHQPVLPERQVGRPGWSGKVHAQLMDRLHVRGIAGQVWKPTVLRCRITAQNPI